MEKKSDLEANFKSEIEMVKKKIDAHLKNAHTSLNKACKLADEHGLSFYSIISPLGQDYGTDNSFKDKWMKKNKISSEEDLEFDMGEIMEDLNCWEPEYDGWQHSAVC